MSLCPCGGSTRINPCGFPPAHFRAPYLDAGSFATPGLFPPVYPIAFWDYSTVWRYPAWRAGINKPRYDNPPMFYYSATRACTPDADLYGCPPPKTCDKGVAYKWNEANNGIGSKKGCENDCQCNGTRVCDMRFGSWGMCRDPFNPAGLAS